MISLRYSLRALFLASALSSVVACANLEGDLDDAEGDLSTEPAAATRPTKKWHPGHYVNGGFGESIEGTYSFTTQHPVLAGVSFVHPWRELEPVQGRYDFTRIRAELAAARRTNKRLIIQIADKTFKNQGHDCVPDYVKNGPQYLGGQSIVSFTNDTFRGCVSLRWVPAVQDRLIALYQALGRELDGEPNFEAVMTQEDAFTPDGTNYATYTARAYTDQQKRGMTALAGAFPRSQIFKTLNWGPNLREIIAHGAALGITVATPDILPTYHVPVYPFYAQYAGRTPLQASMQWPRPREFFQRGETTIQGIYDFAVFQSDGLHVNYVIWDRVNDALLSFRDDIVPMLEARSGAINTSCPSNIICR